MSTLTERKIQILEREIDIITKLHEQAIVSGAIDNSLQESYNKLIAHKHENIAEIKARELASTHLAHMANEISDLRLQQRVSDNALIKRSELFYDIQGWPSGLISELRLSYQRMELAHREGSIFIFGSYVMQQVEAVANYYVGSKVGKADVSTDMRTTIAKGPNTGKFLYELIITGTSYKAKEAKRNLQNSPSYIIEIKDLELMVKIKYLFWYCKNKAKGESPFLRYTPFSYLTTARNKASHGYFASSSSDEEKRYQDMLNNPAIYFVEFYSILNELRDCLK